MLFILGHRSPAQPVVLEEEEQLAEDDEEPDAAPEDATMLTRRTVPSSRVEGHDAHDEYARVPPVRRPANVADGYGDRGGRGAVPRGYDSIASSVSGDHHAPRHDGQQHEDMYDDHGAYDDEHQPHKGSGHVTPDQRQQLQGDYDEHGYEVGEPANGQQPGGRRPPGRSNTRSALGVGAAAAGGGRGNMGYGRQSDEDVARPVAQHGSEYTGRGGTGGRYGVSGRQSATGSEYRKSHGARESYTGPEHTGGYAGGRGGGGAGRQQAYHDTVDYAGGGNTSVYGGHGPRARFSSREYDHPEDNNGYDEHDDGYSRGYDKRGGSYNTYDDRRYSNTSNASHRAGAAGGYHGGSGGGGRVSSGYRGNSQGGYGRSNGYGNGNGRYNY